MMNRDILIQAGIQYQKGVARCSEDAELYEALLQDFADDDMLTRAQAAFAQGNRKALFDIAHETRGISANLDIPRLLDVSIRLVNALRNPSDDEKCVVELFKAYEGIYKLTLYAIQSASKGMMTKPGL